jgi:hypothetical protein
MQGWEVLPSPAPHHGVEFGRRKMAVASSSDASLSSSGGSFASQSERSEQSFDEWLDSLKSTDSDADSTVEEMSFERKVDPPKRWVTNGRTVCSTPPFSSRRRPWSADPSAAEGCKANNDVMVSNAPASNGPSALMRYERSGNNPTGSNANHGSRFILPSYSPKHTTSSTTQPSTLTRLSASSPFPPDTKTRSSSTHIITGVSFSLDKENSACNRQVPSLLSRSINTSPFSQYAGTSKAAQSAVSQTKNESTVAAGISKSQIMPKQIIASAPKMTGCSPSSSSCLNHEHRHDDRGATWSASSSSSSSPRIEQEHDIDSNHVGMSHVNESQSAISPAQKTASPEPQQKHCPEFIPGPGTTSPELRALQAVNDRLRDAVERLDVLMHENVGIVRVEIQY